MSDDKILLTVGEAADRLGIARSFLYRHMAEGQVRSIKLGRARRIPVSELEAFVRRRLVEESVNPDAA